MSKSIRRILISIVVAGVLLLVNRSLTTQPSTPPASHASTTTATSATTAPELASASCHMNGQLPDASCTPGATNPDVTQANIAQTICQSGYTKTIRPTVTYTDSLKQQQMQSYGFSDSVRAHEEDHLISLELGGAPSDPKNLWPEPGASPNPKDKIENFLHAEVCTGKITLHDAQTRITTNWVTAEQGL